MNTLKKVLGIAVFTLFVGTAFANNEPTGQSATQEIKRLLEKSSVFETIDREVKLHVTFKLNSDNEIIVLSTNDKKIASEIKAALNHQKVDSKDLVQNKKYTLPMVLKKR